MADSKISALAAITSLADADEMVVASSGVSNKITGLNLRKSIFATTYDVNMGGDVTIVNANTFYDGPSQSLVAGTWLILWRVELEVIVSTSQNYFWTAKLWDGSTVYDECELQLNSNFSQNGAQHTINGFALVTLSGTQTMKVSVAEGHGSSSSKILRDALDNTSSAHKASRLVAIKIG